MTTTDPPPARIALAIAEFDAPSGDARPAPAASDQGLVDALRARARPGDLYEKLAEGRLRCVACAHHCVIAPGRPGSCGVRHNIDGELRVPFGYVARRYVRAVETNTIFHLAPGERSLTFGMFGCDLRCPYCQNHRISQALRDGASLERPIDMTPEALVDEARAAGCSVICAAYNEPMISAEWARHVFEHARSRGFATAVVSDGNSTPQALEYMRPVTDVFRVDLKAASDAAYHQLGGRLSPVLASIRRARELGYWVEVVTLIVPGLNHDLESIRTLGGALKAIDADIPWHLNAFVPRYQMKDRPPADRTFLISAAGAAYAAGMRFVYVGNVPQLAELSHTRCPNCHAVVVERENYETRRVHLSSGRCPQCSTAIPGRWTPVGAERSITPS